MQSPFPSIPKWRNPRTIWNVPGHPGVRLVRLVDPDDVKEWAHYIGHSGGNYTHWVCDLQIWHFLTFIDADGRPHCTIHLKDSEWFAKPHPDDTKREKGFKFGMRLYVPSTTYDHEHEIYGKADIDLDGHRVMVMAVGHRDNDDFEFVPEERKLFEMWYDSLTKYAPLAQ